MSKAKFQSFFEKHIWNFTLEDPSRVLNGQTISEILGGGKKTASGKNVTVDTALQFSAVWGCVQAFASPFSYFPVKLYRYAEDGTRERIYKDPILTALERPRLYMTRNTLMERAMVHLKLWGNAYIEPIRTGGRQITGFFIHHPTQVDVRIINEGGITETVVYVVKDKSGTERPLTPNQIIHIAGLGDEVVGKSVIGYAREDIGLEMAARDYGSGFFADGGKPTGVLTFDSVLTKDQYQDIKEKHKLQKMQGGDLVIGANAKYTPFSIPPEDAQFLGTRIFGVTTIARWFGVPPWKIADLSNGSTFRNIEEMGIAFLKDAMAPVVEKFETAFNNVIFGPDSDMKIEIDMEAYLRADAVARAEMYRTGIQNGYKKINEVRAENGDNPVDNGDRPLIQSNMIPLDKIDDMLNKPEMQNAIAKAIADKIK